MATSNPPAMTRHSAETRSEPSVRPDAGGSVPVDFETAQRQLFDAVGLDVTSSSVDGSMGRLHVLETGSAAGEPPLVFVHGTGAFGAFFAPLLAAFDAGRLVTFDRPGYGLSDPHRYSGATIRRTVVTALEDVLDALEVDRVDLVGHSMGGQTALRFALEQPERVRRLALVGAVVGFPGTRPPTPIRLLTAPVLNRVIRRLQRPGEAGVLDIAEIFGEREAITAHPAFIRAIAAHEADPARAATGFSEFKALVSVRGWRSSARIPPTKLRTLQPPTTLVWGDHDTLGGPDAVRDGVDLIPDGRFERVAAGHIPFLAHPERCAELVRS